MSVRAFSFGGGWQSTAALVLAAQGRVDFRTFIMANVGDDSENPATVRYVEEYAKPFAADHGIELVVLERIKRDGSTETLYGRLTREGSRSLPIPVRMSNGAPGTRSCTADFKIKVIGKELKRRGASKHDPATVGIGISVDEIHRANSRRCEPHERIVYPLLDLGIRRTDCPRIIASAGLPMPEKSSCWFCLAGETEVVTRDGIARIADLAGRTVDLLVPTVGIKGGLSECGHFTAVPVRSFGVQPLLAVHLRRGRTKKTIRATAEHRWLLAPGKQWVPVDGLWRTSATLVPGDRLRSLHATALSKEQPLPFAVAQGFVFGDGTRGQGNRPAALDIHNGKECLLPYFPLHDVKPITTTSGGKAWRLYGLPRSWKALPDLRESRAFLLGWLSGWFAADGSVGKRGQAVLYAADPAHLEFARSAFAVLGVRASSIASRIRDGFGRPTVLHSLCFSPRDVPIEFFVRPRHREHVASLPTARRDQHWSVASVEVTDRVEEVFCATVDSVGAFALADGLMTGNCPFHRPETWQEQRRSEPELFEKACSLEELLNERRDQLGKDHVYLTRFNRPLREAIPDGVDLLPLVDEGDGACDSGWCMT